MGTVGNIDPLDFFGREDWTAGVMGLGYVGLPLVMELARADLDCIGYDLNDSRIVSLNKGRSHVEDVSDEALDESRPHVEFTSDASRLKFADAIFICVPSPLGRNRQPDLSFIEDACRTISEVARSGQLIVLESTSYPGTTEDFLEPAVRSAGLEVDKDVFVAFAPERVSPGDKGLTGALPKVVGGLTELSGLVAEAAYSRIAPTVYRVSSARAAEMTKLLENTYRAVNIGLINEMAQLAHELEIDIWEVIDAASTKPEGFHVFYPGPGVGGHCIPLDPQYLAWRAKEANFATRFIDTAEQVNTKMPMYTVDRVADLLNRRGLPVYRTSILGVGISYKRDVGDDRESASLAVLRELTHRGANIAVMDPLVGKERIELHGYESIDNTDELSRFAAGVILTDHSSIDYARLARELPAVLDTRGVFRRLGIRGEHIENL